MAHKKWNPACKVYICNLGESTSKQDIESSFSKYGPLKNVWIARPPWRYAFVEFEDARHARNAAVSLDGKVLGEGRIRVEMSTGRFRQPDAKRKYYDNGYLGGGVGGRRGGRKGYSWAYKSANVATYAIQGLREHMEDRFVVHENFKDTGVSLFAIFDGHVDKFAVEYVSENLIESLKKKIIEIKTMVKEETATDEEADENSTSSKSEISIEMFRGNDVDYKNRINFRKLLVEEVLRIDKLLIQAAKNADTRSGTTALIAVIEKEQLTVASVGDSRGVMCDGRDQVLPLSFDHKPQNILERRRIEDAGGFITYNRNTRTYRVNGVLAMSRALGVDRLKDLKVLIADPNIVTLDLADYRPKFILLASDGLWDVFTNKEAVDYVKPLLNKESFFGAKSITREAKRRGSADNITVLIINLSNRNWGAACTRDIDCAGR